MELLLLGLQRMGVAAIELYRRPYLAGTFGELQEIRIICLNTHDI